MLSWDAATSTAYARVFAGDLRWGEDPATGSAALGMGVWLVATGLLPGEGTSSYVVRQGEKLGRPSVLSCTVTAAGGAAVVRHRAAAPSSRSRAAGSACRSEQPGRGRRPGRCTGRAAGTSDCWPLAVVGVSLSAPLTAMVTAPDAGAGVLAQRRRRGRAAAGAAHPRARRR